MKNTYLLLILFLLPLLVLSQGNVRPIALEDAGFNAYFENASVPIVTGKLVNASAKEISEATITYVLPTPFLNFQTTKSAKVAKDGTFKLAFDYAFPYQQIFVSIGDYGYISIWAHKDLFIELDLKKLKAFKDSANSLEGVKYLGTDDKLNSWVENFRLYKTSKKNELGNRKRLLLNDSKLTSTDLYRKYDSIFAEYEHLEKAYISKNPSPYSWILENERLSDYYGQFFVRNWYKTMDADLWERVSRHKSYLVSNNGMLFYNYLYTYIATLPVNKAAAVTIDEILAIKDLNETERAIIDSVKYYNKVGNDISRSFQFMNKLNPRISKLLTEKRNSLKLHCLDSLFAPSKADLLKLQMGSEDPFEQKSIYNYSLASMHTIWTKKVFTSKKQQIIIKIAAINKSLSQSSTKVISLGLGVPVIQTPFGASLYKISGISATEFLAKLKIAFPNKALIIDFWATWCGPCLEEMPFSKKLHEELKGQPVEFIYLCTSRSSDETKWKLKIAELKQPGIHFFVDNSLEKELMNQFSFNEYPSFAFFDKKGQYKPGAIDRMSQINKDQLSELINIQQPVKL